MRSAVLNVTFDCGDAAGLARFWSGVTRWPASLVEMPGNPFWLVADGESGGVHLVFVEVAEVKAVKNRVHLDLTPAEGSQEEEVARLVGLGARILDDRRESTPGGWLVMADPEGNEFCLEQGE